MTAGHLKKRGFRPKRGRPTADQVSKINSAILMVAKERFLADGYAGTSMDAIAAAAGVSKGTLYSRHPHKESLLRAVVSDQVAAWSADASKQNWQLVGNTLEQRLKHHAKTVMVRGVSAEVQAFNRLLDGAPETARAHHDLLYTSMVDYLAGVILEFTRADGQPAKKPKHVAETLMAALAGWLRMEMRVRNVPERDAIAFAHGTIDLLIAGRSAW